LNQLPADGGWIWQTFRQDTRKQWEILTCPICPRLPLPLHLLHFRRKKCKFWSEAEYEEVVQRLGRHPNKAELGMFWLHGQSIATKLTTATKQFPTTGSRILVGPGENAGVVDLGTAATGIKLNPTTTLQLLNLSRSYRVGGILRTSSRWERVPLPC